MGFVRPMKTSAKVTIPDSARKELEYLFHYEIATMIETHNIPHSMITNIDQIPLRYLTVGNFTLTEKGGKSVVIEGNNNKRCITGMFGISFLTYSIIKLIDEIIAPYLEKESEAQLTTNTKRFAYHGCS